MDYSVFLRPKLWAGIFFPLMLIAYGLYWFATESQLIWQDFFVFILFYQLTLFGIAIGSHRYFAHRAFKASQVMESILFILASAAFQYSPIYWAAKHRKHHRFTDLPGDPHSPKDGWIHAYFLWAFKFPFEKTMQEYAQDWMKKDHIMKLHRNHYLIGISFILLPGVIEWCMLDFDSFGFVRGVFWGGLFRILVLHNSIFTLNTLAGHGFGTQIFILKDSSRNNIGIFPFVWGDCWHHNHHASPSSATYQARWYHIDPFYYVLCGLEKIGLVSELKPFRNNE